MSSINACDFCDEFSGGISNSFRACYGQSVRDRTAFASENFRVFPSLGQIVEGYLLISPIAHYTTVDTLPVNLLVELVDVCRQVRSALSKTYGPCVFFEHAARTPLNGGCGIYHAHLHATPLARIPDPIDALKATFPYIRLGRLDEIRREGARLPCYLLYEDTHARLYLFDTGPLPSQYMRKRLADALHEANWNWRAAGREERFLDTMERLSGQFDAT